MLMQLDWGVLHWIQAHLTGGVLDGIMLAITRVGGLWLWVAAAMALLCTKKYRRQGVLLLAGILAAATVNAKLLKPLFARPRPCWLEPNVPLLVPSPGDFSFPSGHTVTAFAGAAVLWGANRRFGWAVFPAAALTAFSRLYLFVHFPSDVLGGGVIGTALGLAVFYGGSWAMGRLQKVRHTGSLTRSVGQK